MVAPLDVSVVGPALPVIAEAFTVSRSRAGLVITAFAVPGALLAPVVGGLADRYGRRRVLIPCLLVFGFAGVAVSTVDAFPAVLALRALQGSVGGSIIASLAYTVVGDLYEGAQRNAVMGVVSGSVAVVAAVGPALGGALAESSWRAVFWVYGLSVAVAVVVLFALPEPTAGKRPDGGDGGEKTGAESDAASDSRAYLREAVDALPVARTLGVYAAAFLTFTLFFGGVLTTVPFLLSDGFGLGAGSIGALITGATAVSAVAAFLNGRFARHATDETLVSVGLSAAGLGLAGVAVAPTLPAVAGGLVVFGAGYGLFQPSLASALAALSPARFRGGVMSLRTSVVLAGQAAGPPLFTLPAEAVGTGPPLFVAGAVGVAAGVAAYLGFGWHERA